MNTQYTYKFYTDNKHICKVTSTFAGVEVTGVAKCDPRDTFDKNVGFEIARARCDYKIARKRCNRAMEKYGQAARKEIKASKYRNKMGQYVMDAVRAEEEAEFWLDSIMEKY